MLAVPPLRSSARGAVSPWLSGSALDASLIADAPAVYRPRHFEKTAFYQLLAEHFEPFVRGHEERYEPTDGPLRPVAPHSRGISRLWPTRERLRANPLPTVFHPHVHAIVTEGAWSRGGEFLPCDAPDRSVIEEVFRREVLARLHRAERLSDEFRD